jgi:hypothetical protein
LNSIYKKIYNIREDPNYTKGYTISKLFISKDVQKAFYHYIEDYPLTNKRACHTKIESLRSNIEEELKIYYDDNSIKKEDFKDDGLNLPSLYEKLSNVMENKDINTHSTIRKLNFEPYSLKKVFFSKLVDLNLTTSKRVDGNTISSLKNKIRAKLTLISCNEFTEDG